MFTFEGLENFCYFLSSQFSSFGETLKERAENLPIGKEFLTNQNHFEVQAQA